LDKELIEPVRRTTAVLDLTQPDSKDISGRIVMVA